MTRDVSVAIFGDVNMNVIDGSSVWTQSICLAFASIPNVSVQLISKAPIENERLLGPLMKHPDIDVVVPQGNDAQVQLSPERARQLLETDLKWDIVVVRGRDAAEVFASSEIIAGHLWCYLTDVPQHPLEITDSITDQINLIGSSSQAVLCQTEELRSFLEATFASMGGKCWLVPPMIPDAVRRRPLDPPTRNNLELIYSGKYASAWNTLEMCSLPASLERRGIVTNLTMVGDKINKDPANPSFVADMRSALEDSIGVTWAGGMSRVESLEAMASAHIGLSWRSSSMSDSMELSTKLLEYCAVGTPPILNNTPMHKSIFGTDYPLFADSEDEVLRRIERIVNDSQVYVRAMRKTQTVAGAYTISEGAKRLARLVSRYLPEDIGISPSKHTVLVISHDLKFFEPLQSQLDSIDNVELTLDRWPALDEHDAVATENAIQDADIVICEWCGPNAIFASTHKRAGQRLFVRLHRFELYSGYWKNMDIEAVDKVITVSPHYRDLTLSMTGWPDDKVVVIPNYVDSDQLARPKMTGSRFHIGMIGLAPRRKRLDLALRVVKELRSIDPRFTMFVKSKMPWDYPWIWDVAAEKEHYAAIFRELADPELARGVVFDGFGADVGAWLRKIGFVISTSDDESFHLSPAEGMASGAVPIVRDWPGAETIYDPHWITSVDEMATRIYDVGRNEERWLEESAIAQRQVATRYSIERVDEMWRALLA